MLMLLRMLLRMLLSVHTRSLQSELLLKVHWLLSLQSELLQMLLKVHLLSR